MNGCVGAGVQGEMEPHPEDPAPLDDAGEPAPAGARLVLVLFPFLVVLALMLLEGWLRKS